MVEESQSPILFSFDVGGMSIDISNAVVIQWVVILVLTIVAICLTRNLKQRPDKKQAALEKIYDMISSTISSTMGEGYKKFLPYVGSLMLYLLVLNFMGLIGIEPPTKDLSVTAGLAVSSFLVIHGTAIKRNGVGGYLHGYFKPFWFMSPINIMEKITFPISIALRLFGNMLAATILVDMVYEFLGSFCYGIFSIGAPIILHGYFDLFDGAIQMVVFSMLTMIQIKLTAEE